MTTDFQAGIQVHVDWGNEGNLAFLDGNNKIDADIISYSLSRGQPFVGSTFQAQPVRGFIILDNSTGKYTNGFTEPRLVTKADLRAPRPISIDFGGNFPWYGRGWVESRTRGEQSGNQATMRVVGPNEYSASKNIQVRQPLDSVNLKQFMTSWVRRNTSPIGTRRNLLNLNSIPAFINIGPFIFDGKLIEFLNRIAEHCGGILIPEGPTVLADWRIGFVTPDATVGGTTRKINTYDQGRLDASTGQLLMNTTKNQAVFGSHVEVARPEFNASTNFFAKSEQTGAQPGILASIVYDVTNGTQFNAVWEPTWSRTYSDIVWSNPVAQFRLGPGTANPNIDTLATIDRVSVGSQIAGITLQITPKFTGKLVIDFMGIPLQLEPAAAYRDRDYSGSEGTAYLRSIRDYGPQEMIVPQWLPVHGADYSMTLVMQRLALYRRYWPWRTYQYKFYAPGQAYAVADRAFWSGYPVDVDERIRTLPIGHRIEGGINTPSTFEVNLLSLGPAPGAKPGPGPNPQDPDGEGDLPGELPDGELIPPFDPNLPPDDDTNPFPEIPDQPVPGEPEEPEVPPDDTGDTDIDDILDEPPGDSACTVDKGILCIVWGEPPPPPGPGGTLDIATGWLPYPEIPGNIQGISGRQTPGVTGTGCFYKIVGDIVVEIFWDNFRRASWWGILAYQGYVSNGALVSDWLTKAKAGQGILWDPDSAFPLTVDEPTAAKLELFSSDNTLISTIEIPATGSGNRYRTFGVHTDLNQIRGVSTPYILGQKSGSTGSTSGTAVAKVVGTTTNPVTWKPAPTN